MTPEEARKLLGGYSTGTLTPEERRALFEAALLDEELFEELAREQALKDVLDDPEHRAELLRLVDEPAPSSPAAASGARRRWWTLGLAGAAAVTAAAITVLVVVNTNQNEVEPRQMARLSAPAEMPDIAQPAPNAESAQPAREKASGERRPALRAARPLPQRKSAPAAGDADEARALPPPPIAPQAVTAADAPPPAAIAAPESRQPESREKFTAGAPRGEIVPERTGVTPTAAPAAAELVEPRAKLNALPRPRALGDVKAASAFARREFTLSYSVPIAVEAAEPREIAVETNMPAYLYAFRRVGPGGDWAPVNPGGVSVAAGARSTLPPPGDAQSVLLIASRRPIQDLAASGAELTAAVERVRQSSRETRLAPLASHEWTAMAATAAGPDACIVVDIPLGRPR